METGRPSSSSGVPTSTWAPPPQPPKAKSKSRFSRFGCANGFSHTADKILWIRVHHRSQRSEGGTADKTGRIREAALEGKKKEKSSLQCWTWMSKSSELSSRKWTRLQVEPAGDDFFLSSLGLRFWSEVIQNWAQILFVKGSKAPWSFSFRD